MRITALVMMLAMLAFPAFMHDGTPEGGAGQPADAYTTETADAESTKDALTTDGATLWDKSISLQVGSELPEIPFSGDDTRVVLMTNDGSSLLVCGGTDPYLWNMDTRERTDLFPGDEETCRAMREALDTVMTDARGNAAYAAASDIPDEELLEAYLVYTSRNPGRANMFKSYTRSALPGPYVQLYDFNGMQWLLDGETGALYTRGTETIDSIYEGTMLILPQRPSAYVKLCGEDGSTRQIPLSAGFASGDVMMAATFLPDGHICAVLREAALDMYNGQQCAVLIWGDDGTRELYPLGRVRLGQEPDCILSADARNIVLYSRISIVQNHPYLIRRDTGSVSLLTESETSIGAIPLSDCLDATTGAVTQPDGLSVYVVAAMADGKTLLAYDMQTYSLALLRPDDMACRYPLRDSPYSQIPAPIGLWGNGYDRWLFLSSGGMRIATVNVGS